MDSVEVVQHALEDTVGNLQPFNLAVRAVGAIREKDRAALITLYIRKEPVNEQENTWICAWNEALDRACDVLGISRPSVYER